MTATMTDLSRVDALRRYRTEDVPPEGELEGIVRLAATVSGTTTATLNLLDAQVQRNWVTAGFPGGECALEDSLCVVALRERAAVYTPDASQDPRFCQSPWVDGRLDTIRLYASAPLTTPDGWMIGTLCVFGSQARELAPEVLAALDDLAATAMALLERRRLTRVAQEATQAKSASLAAISHDLRTPMNGVLGMLDVVLCEQLPGEARQAAELARRSAGALLTLVDDVLELSKGEAGHLTLAPCPFDPAALVQDVAEALRVLAGRKGLALSARVQQPVPSMVLGDPDRIRQVLVNLLGNAIKFTNTGAVELRLSGRETGTGEVELQIEVQDTGEGIAPDELETLFTAFAQGRSGHRHGGTGLGLSICAQLASLMDGRLDVASTVGEGTTFTFCVRLPLAPEAPLHVPEQIRRRTVDCTGLRVLVADDSEVNQLVVSALLSSLGAEVDAVADGAAAVERAATGRYDLLLLDHEMPGMDGPTAAQRIRSLPDAVRATPIFALTGHVGEQALRDCLAAGMDGRLTKPLDPAELSRVLGELPRRGGSATC